MSTRTVVNCDTCGKEIKGGAGGVHGFSRVVDRRADAAGGMEDVTEDHDLCGRCCSKYLRQFLEKGLKIDRVWNNIAHDAMTQANYPGMRALGMSQDGWDNW